MVHVVYRPEPIIIRNESWKGSADYLTRPPEEGVRGSYGTVEAQYSLGRASSEEKVPGSQPAPVDADGAVRYGTRTRSRAPAAVSPPIFGAPQLSVSMPIRASVRATPLRTKAEGPKSKVFPEKLDQQVAASFDLTQSGGPEPPQIMRNVST